MSLYAAEGTTLGDFVSEDVKEFLHPFWHKFPILSPWVYYLMGFFWTLGGLFSLLGNFLVLYLFIKSPKLRSPSNFLVVNLALSDFMIMASLVPEFVVNCASGGNWQFGKLGCTIHAFCGSIFGYSQITTLVFISYDRFNVIVNGFNARPITYLKVFLILLFIWAFSLGWALAPIYGFGGYTLDGILTECSFDYLTTDTMNIAFMWSVTTCMYFLPLSIILFAYFHIVKAVINHEDSLKKQAKIMKVVSLRNKSNSELHAEIRIAKVAMINVSLWVMAWTPFVVICLIGVSGDQSWLTPLIGSLSVVFAKTSCLYNPIIYAISHPKYQQALRMEIPWIWPALSDHPDYKEPNKSEQTKV